MEDIPPNVKVELEQYSKELGFEQILIIDAHNSMGEKIESKDINNFILIGKRCLDEINVSKQFPFKIGYSNSFHIDDHNISKMTKAPDIGDGHALALLMLPVVTRSSEVVLALVPNALREGALALGAPRWRVVFRVVLPTAAPGIVTGSLLAVARGAGETAPLLFTAFAVNGTNLDPSLQMNSLPVQIFNNVRQAQSNIVERASGAALTLVAMILLLTLIARLIQRRSRLT